MVKKLEKKKEEKYVMVCPKCKSPDIKIDKTNPLQPAMGLPAMYICGKCGHSGYAFPEVPLSELDKFEEGYNKERIVDSVTDKSLKVDTSYGSFVVRVLWKISSPITLIFGIFSLFKEPILGYILILSALVMFYITYFKKRKLRED